MTYTIRPATSQDISQFYEKNTTYATKAWAVDYNGALACVAGVELRPKQAVVFSGMIDGIDAPKLTIWRCARDLMDKIRGLNLPLLVAICDDRFINSPRFLRKLGFKEVSKEVFVWE